MASRFARLGKLLGWASLWWMVLTGGPSVLGILFSGGAMLPRDSWEAMLALWGFVAAPILVFGMSAPLRDRPRVWSTVLSLIRLNVTVAVPVGGAYAALLWFTISSPTRFKDALMVYAATTVVAIVAVNAIAMAGNPPTDSDARRP